MCRVLLAPAIDNAIREGGGGRSHLLSSSSAILFLPSDAYLSHTHSRRRLRQIAREQEKPRCLFLAHYPIAADACSLALDSRAKGVFWAVECYIVSFFPFVLLP